MAESVPLRCNSAVLVDLTLEEVFRRFDQLFSEERVESELAKAVRSHFRSQFFSLVRDNVVVDEEDPAGSVTLEELLDEELRRVARLRASVPTLVRRRSEQAAAQQ